jgi:hypothetical protein
MNRHNYDYNNHENEGTCNKRYACGHNQMKRAFRDVHVCDFTDAKNPSHLGVIHELQKVRFERDPIKGYAYIRLIPNRRQRQSDRIQLKTFPGYRLIECDD